MTALIAYRVYLSLCLHLAAISKHHTIIVKHHAPGIGCNTHAVAWRLFAWSISAEPFAQIHSCQHMSRYDNLQCVLKGLLLNPCVWLLAAFVACHFAKLFFQVLCYIVLKVWRVWRDILNQFLRLELKTKGCSSVWSICWTCTFIVVSVNLRRGLIADTPRAFRLGLQGCDVEAMLTRVCTFV